MKYKTLEFELDGRTIELKVATEKIREWLIGEIVDDLKKQMGTLLDGHNAEFGAWAMASYLVDKLELVDDVIEYEDSYAYCHYNDRLYAKYSNEVQRMREEIAREEGDSEYFDDRDDRTYDFD